MESRPQTCNQGPLYRFLDSIWLICLALILTGCKGGSPQLRFEPLPKTRTANVKEVIHRVEIVDPYRWLEDRNSPETQAWIESQSIYTQFVLSRLPGREQVKRRLTELQKIDVITPPLVRRDRYFFSKRLANQELYVIYMREGLKGNDQVLVDPHPMSPDHSTSVDLLAVSKDGTVIAYAVRQGGADEVTVHLLNVVTKQDLPDRLPKADYFSLSIRPDKRGLYYSRREPDGPRVYYHALGTDSGKDTQLFGKGYGTDKIIESDLSEDGRYLLIQVEYGAAAQRTEIYYQDLAGHSLVKPVVNDIDARFLGAVGGDRLFLLTNWKAPKGRILTVDLNHPGRDRWREVVAEGDAVIESVAPLGGKLVVNYIRDVSSQVRVFDPDGQPVRDLTLPAIGTASLSGLWESPEAFLAFSSYPIPTTIYHYDLATGQQEEWARLKVPVDSDRLEVKQVWYESKDKTRIPMFLVYAKGIQLDGSRPTFLTGYGGFNVSNTPSFSSIAVLWAERGGVYAMTNLRGGGEFGEEWHKAGMLANKQNVFNDFIAAAEWLIQNRYTNPSQLAIEGASNGGLLVGAALTQRPDLFRAVACGYPLLDMVRYHRFLEARYWVAEYGSSEDPTQFPYLYAYSPYHRVKDGTNYPAVLFFTGDSDTRVDPLHARKMAALLQSINGADRPVLLRYDTTSGHSGGLPLSKQIDEMTDEQIFLSWQLGMTAAQP